MANHYQIHAQFCRAIANEKRLEILDLLRRDPMNVTQLAEAMGITAANVSQHLHVLKQEGVVLGTRRGATVFYRLAYPELMEAYDQIGDILRRLQESKVRQLSGGTDGDE